MIDLVAENVMSLSEAAKSNAMPRRRRGRRPNVSTLYRWARKGCNGVILETIRVGGTLCTSLQAIQRFAVRLTVEDGPHDARVDRGELPAVRFGHSVRIDPADLRDFIEQAKGRGSAR